ncbi:tRNA lysidine(34) synthetase TilS [Flaviflagellibacter deserti]|uniref:tRNA(Ile)-lysidine synthase n=1 Tax=Flaviflagellibacter deserti TaxID=2267266 RepID=A0ABV9YWL0_9HYPH
MPRPGGPVTEEEAAALFQPLEGSVGVLAAVSGGADSTALLLLLARWSSNRGLRLCAATIDHGLRPESGDEAEKVAALARLLGIDHRTLRWTGAKPVSSIEKAARTARYRLLMEYAAEIGALHLVTAHTLDDQAETVLMRLAAGSGPAGLAGMRPVSARGDLIHVRPLLGVPKTRLIATCDAAGVSWSEDASNADPRFARARLRAGRDVLDREGLTAERLAVLARRMARADVAIEQAVDNVWAGLAMSGPAQTRIDGASFLALPEEIGLRMMLRAVGKHGDGTSERLKRGEALFDAVRDALQAGKSLGRTLGGARVAVSKGQLVISTAPPRRETV